MPSFTHAWSQVNKLTASDGDNADWFGALVAVSSDALSIVVLAPGESVDVISSQSGSAYLFQHNSTNSYDWTQVQKFIPSDQDPNVKLGYSIAVEYSTIVVGIFSGSVYIFDLNKKEETSGSLHGNDPGLSLLVQVVLQSPFLLYWWL
jgi:hypothetical protein